LGLQGQHQAHLYAFNSMISSWQLLIQPSVSSETIKIGDLKIDDIIGTLAGVCHESGQCETNDIELKSTLWFDNSRPELKVTLGPDGTYPTCEYIL
jgi:hypothetical protein